MLNDFSSASAIDAIGQTYEGPQPPFGGFVLPAFLPKFSEKMLQSNAAHNFPIEQMFLFGGAITDQKLGLKPKDYDVYMSSPALVETVKEVLSRGKGHRANIEIEENILGNDFPILLHDESFSFKTKRGDDFSMFAINGIFEHNGAHYRMDITVGDKTVSLPEFSAARIAPMLSALVTLHPQMENFAYHQDFERQVQARVLCSDDVDNPQLVDKAKRKSLEIITPSAWEARLAL